MKTRQIVCWLLCIASPALAQVSPWSSGTYAYDGSGNVKAIGADYYVYDQVGRLVRGSADKERTGADSYQAYTYDAFGNRLTTITTGTACVNGCGVNVQVNNNGVTNNRVTDHGASYDAAGNLKQFDTSYYTYDGAGMLVTRSSSPTSADEQYIYTADDERLAVYTGGGNWRVTIRDLDAKVLREVTAFQSGGTTTWTWQRDHIFRDGPLLATILPEGVQHYHLDHLGTPRLVTDGTGRKLGVHAYYPFGDELNLGLGEQLSPERLKFTGHERDVSNGASLDDMHARYYSPGGGRFLSVDPVLGNLLRPGSWNRYAYVLNNPMNYTDPTGMRDTGSIVTCSGPGGGIPCITVTAKDPLTLRDHLNAALDEAADQMKNASYLTPGDFFNGRATVHGLEAFVDGAIPDVPFCDSCLTVTDPFVTHGGYDINEPGMRSAQIAGVPTGEVAMSVIGGQVIKGFELGKSSRLFAKTTGALNHNDYLRAGWSWRGSRKAGQPVFRVVAGGRKFFNLFQHGSATWIFGENRYEQ
jgi:RHS repeat-associated protein